jgi:SAM-dependent methyltransferase
MHPRAFLEFDRICAARGIAGRVLEIGAVPSNSTLLSMPSLAKAACKIGINLDGPYEHSGFSILRVNANQMDCFRDGEFDAVVSNAVLEHDRFFWKTLAEIRRVTRPGGLIVLGAPGYGRFPACAPAASAKQFLIRALSKASFLDPLQWLLKSAPTIEIHDAPGDYYRFSSQTFREVFFDGMNDVEVRSILFPPVIIGAGARPA